MRNITKNWGFLPIIVFGLIPVLQACVADQNYLPPKFSFAERYKEGRSGSPTLLRNDKWWIKLDDPMLNSLVDRALLSNVSIEVARSRIDSAKAVADASSSLMSLSSSASIQAQKSSVDSVALLEEKQQLELSWLLDPFGANKAVRRARDEEAKIAMAEFDAARLALLYKLASTYVDLRYRQEKLSLIEKEMIGRQKTLATVTTLLTTRRTTKLEETRSQARVSALEAEIPRIQSEITAKQNEIAVLLGSSPGDISFDLDRRRGQPKPSMASDIGIPADLIRNRPDIQIAERQYYIALTGQTQANADLYPKLSLSGALTLRTTASGLNSASSYFFGPSLQLPIFPGSPAKAMIRKSQADVVTAHGQWKNSVLNALLEVENALLDYHATSTSLIAAERTVKLQGEALSLTRQLFSFRDATLGDVISAEQELADANSARADLMYQRNLAYITLNIRLGAGSNASGSE